MTPTMIKYDQTSKPEIYRFLKISMVLLFALLPAISVDGQGFVATRLNNNQPIITEKMFLDLGASGEEGWIINGPSLIRIPDWILPENRADSSAVYYLYFANHHGNYIPMAWSAELEGPWNLYHTGADYKSGFRGVLNLGPDDTISIGNSLTIEKHIASPDVLVDDSNKQIVMYFHGPVREPDGQRTLVATSPDGLSFQEGILPVLLGSSYFRVFEYQNTMYAVGHKAALVKGGTVDDPWLVPPGFDYMEKLWTYRDDNPFEDYIDSIGFDGKVRHTGIHLSEDTLFIFYSRAGDAPERIMMSSMRLDNRPFEEWEPSLPPLEILHPEVYWEGSTKPISPSESGSIDYLANQLRDPDVFEDIDGSLYLLYSGGGEDAIGLARLERTYGNPVYRNSIQAGFMNPELEIFRDLRTGTVSFRLRSSGDTRYEIRIYGIDGRLVEILKGRCLPDGSAQAEWVPLNHKQGIYIANLITNNHSVSVKFIY